ncbi:TPA: hypothetical protein ACWLW2_003885 [Morganella morganii]
MKKIITLLFIFIGTGCAGMAELRQRPADNKFQSDKSTQEVANCILYGWQEKSQTYGSVFIQPAKDGWSVYSAGQLELVDVTSTGDKTNISFYHQGGMFKYRIDNRINSITSCI